MTTNTSQSPRHHIRASAFPLILALVCACSEDPAPTLGEVTTTGSDASVVEGSYTEIEFALTPWPEHDVEVLLMVDAPNEVTLDSDRLFFEGGARRPETITLRGVEDATLDGDQRWMISARSDDRTWSFPGVTRDVDQARLDASVEGTCTEGGGGCSILTSLSAKPLGRVELEVELPPEGFEFVASEPIVFTPDDTTKRLELRATQDDWVTHPEEHTLVLGLRDQHTTGSWNDAPSVELDLERVSDDVASLVYPDTSIVRESDAVLIGVRLGARPRGPVTVPIAFDEENASALTPSMLTFTSSDWSTAQFVELSTLDDMRALERTTSVVFGPSLSSDGAFDGLTGQTLVTVEDGVCGNGVVDGSEACDSGEDVTLECDYGELECQRCARACEWVEGVTTGHCGDGVVQADQGEVCDGGEDASLECDYGETSCIRCDLSCGEVPGEVTGFCGDATVQLFGGEQCDTNIHTNTCQDLGFDYGQVSCEQSTCLEDSAECYSWVEIRALSGCTCLKRHDGFQECWGSLSTLNNDLCNFVDGRSGHIVEGVDHACELDDQGVIVDCNSRSGFGFGENPDPPSTAWSWLSLSHDGGCGVSTTGQLECWGRFYDPTLSPGAEVTPPAGTFERVFTSGQDGCAVDAQGDASCWEYISTLNGSPIYYDPVFSAPVDTIGFRAVPTADARQLCALLTNGALECLGPPGAQAPDQLGVTGAYTKLSMHRNRACALRSNGEAVCWGEWTGGTFAPTPSGPFDTLDVGLRHTCARRTNGEFVCWGADKNGETIVPLGERYESFSRNSAGDTCLIDTHLELKCFGQSSIHGIPVPAGPFVRVEAGYDANCGIRLGGELECFGNAQDAMVHSAPQLLDVVDIEVAGGYACAVRANGALECFGEDFWGAGVLNPPTGTFTDVALVDRVGCAIRTDGTIACWGSSRYPGQTTEHPPLGTFQKIESTQNSLDMCALDTSGQATCWGAFLVPLPGTFDSLTIMDQLFCGHSNNTTNCENQPYGAFAAFYTDWWALRPKDDFIDLTYPCMLHDKNTFVCFGQEHTVRRPLDL